ncbi:MAG: DUF1343 domain-containing protein [Bacteroidales bacterium]|nr:DUF1343 domain-containing protein [Bacteroidales bacterium]
MFSFRTTPIADQPDRTLLEGRVACFCTPNCWDSATQTYLYDIFRRRGNLVRLFTPSGAELDPAAGHIDFGAGDLEGLDAVVVEIQDVGSRYFGYTRDVLRLLSFRARMEEGPSVYIVDHINPAGRVVEGTIPVLEPDSWTPRVAHRHGLTLAELCNLWYGEIGAQFPLHIISALAAGVGKDLLPWTIPPAPDMPGLFSCDMYSGGALWIATSISAGLGTSRPYEYIGAPFLSNSSIPPSPQGVLMRPCSFTPSAGKYVGQVCNGYQIILLPGAQYHSLLHTLQLMRWFADRDSRFEITQELLDRIDDPVISEYLYGRITFDIVQEHVKLEEQKWIRKAKRYVLYEDLPYRMK